MKLSTNAVMARTKTSMLEVADKHERRTNFHTSKKQQTNWAQL